MEKMGTIYIYINNNKNKKKLTSINNHCLKILYHIIKIKIFN